MVITVNLIFMLPIFSIANKGWKKVKNLAKISLLIALACLIVPTVAESLGATTITLNDVTGEINVNFSGSRNSGSLTALSELMNGEINIGDESRHGRIGATINLIGNGLSEFQYIQRRDLDYVPSNLDPIGGVYVFGTEGTELHLGDTGACYEAELHKSSGPFARAFGEFYSIEYWMTTGEDDPEVAFVSRLTGSGEGVTDFIRGYGHGGEIYYDWGSPGVVGMNVRQYGSAKTWAWHAEGEGIFEMEAYAENQLTFNGAVVNGNAYGYLQIEFEDSFDFEPYIGGT